MGYLGEMYAMLRVKWMMRQQRLLLQQQKHNQQQQQQQQQEGQSCNNNNDDTSEDLYFCYDVLQSVSRSFTLVILQLREEVRDAVCVFYLVLRALDTVEDDMRLSVEFKLRELPHFHEHLRDFTWCMHNVGEGRERELLERFPHVSRVFAGLSKCSQDVIIDICARMANGMCEFLTKRVESREDYDLYCHYVAGLVGHGLTRLFVADGFEDVRLLEDLSLANHMGLFLQKTNIIRDFYEDICEDPPRIFWPREIWEQYTDDLHHFKGESALQSHKEKALECLNAMVADALVHVPYAVAYMTSLQEPTIFAFCAIPQVMAMATLAEVFNNPAVFYSKVKITRGATCQIVVNATTLPSALRMMRMYAQQLADHAGPNDVCFDEITERVRAAVGVMDIHLPPDDDGVTRSLLTRYPALGGRLLYSLVDNIMGYLVK